MSTTSPGAGDLENLSESAVLVEVLETYGSTPREQGAWMIVSSDGTLGTIGGGRLEFMAIDKARDLLRKAATGETSSLLSVPLGPGIGQCCGGRVELGFRFMDAATRAELLARLRAEDVSSPSVYIFGGGHVGQALAAVLALAPVKVVLVETRDEFLVDSPAGVETKLTSVPEDIVRDAPLRSAFVVVTHDHSLDFLIAAEALAREDAAYVGMIGSETKNLLFRKWLLTNTGRSEEAFARLTMPIGGASVKDKRPAVIALLTAAEVIAVLVGP